MNQTIVNSPLILFLGAGASAPFGKPTMEPFVADLVRQLGTRLDDQADLLRLLVEFRGNDLEKIFGELDTIIGLDYAQFISGVHKVANSPASFDIAIRNAVELRRQIQHEVIRTYRAVDKKRVRSLFGKLFDQLFALIEPNFNCMPVFTTNYDPSVEEFCEACFDRYEIIDGFSRGNTSRYDCWDVKNFENYTPRAGKRSIVLFKLHGSVDWLRQKESGRIHRGQAMIDHLDSEYVQNVLIYPATRKVAILDPYYTAYEYFRGCCERTSSCLTIGYSFRDYDALMRLRGAAASNVGLALLLWSPTAEAILKDLPMEASQKQAIPFLFDDGINGSNGLGLIETRLRAHLEKLQSWHR